MQRVRAPGRNRHAMRDKFLGVHLEENNSLITVLSYNLPSSERYCRPFCILSVLINSDKNALAAWAYANHGEGITPRYQSACFRVMRFASNSAR